MKRLLPLALALFLAACAAGGQTQDGAQVLRGFPGLLLPAAFLGIIVGIVQQAQPRKNRYRANSHSTRAMVGRYIFHLIDLADSRSVSSALERREEHIALRFPACDWNSRSSSLLFC